MIINKVIYVKYSELTLKKRNRIDFIKQLNKNIKHALSKLETKISYCYDYLLISSFQDSDLPYITEILKKIPGINSFSIGYILDKQINNLVDFIFDFVLKTINDKNIKTFRLTCRRQDKTFIKSDEIIAIVSKKILSKTNLKVQLTNPDLNIFIEVKKDFIVVYFSKQICNNGLPIGTSGRVLLLLSGGIDSPVAAKLLLNRGLKVDFLTFITPPHTSIKALEKVKLLAEKICLNGALYYPKLYVCNFTNLQHELAHIKKESYRITLMRRRFFDIAKKICLKHNYQAIATGESLGQVASQTIESMSVINEVVNDFLVLRPLLTYSKNEIINIAKSIDTYDLSILPYEDSCSLFAPNNPVTKPTLKTAIAMEQKIEWLNDLTDKTINNQIEILELENGKY